MNLNWGRHVCQWCRGIYRREYIEGSVIGLGNEVTFRDVNDGGNGRDKEIVEGGRGRERRRRGYHDSDS